MTALIGAIVVALLAGAVNLYTTRALPTLERRVRDHTALVKDMPADVSGPLRDLLDEEVKQLVARERRRSAPGAHRQVTFRRLSFAGLGIALFGLLITLASTFIGDGSWQGRDETPTEHTVSLWLAGIAYAALAASAVLATIAGVGILRRSRRESD